MPSGTFVRARFIVTGQRAMESGKGGFIRALARFPFGLGKRYH